MKQEKEDRSVTLSESTADLVLGAFFLAFSLVLLFVLIPTQIADAGSTFPTPRSFPRFCAYSMMALSLCLLFQSRRKRGKTKQDEAVTFSGRGVLMALAALAVLVISVVLLRVLPYIPVTSALLIVLMLMLGQRNKFVLAGVGVILPIVVYFFFTHMLKLVLP